MSLRTDATRQLERTDAGSAERSDTTSQTVELRSAEVPKSDPSALSPGTMVGPYEIIRQIGVGGMGRVLLARDTRLGRLAALKFLLRARSTNDANRFVVEARATAQLSHENVVVIYDVGEHEGWPFMALEYVKGQTLRQWIADRKAKKGDAPGLLVLPRVAAELMLPVARALAHAHERGIVHRDMKPSNVVLTDTGGIKVLDFGIAKILSAIEPRPEITLRDVTLRELVQRGRAPSAVQTSSAIGTAMYMAPEQWQIGEVDHRADIWALGLMFHELLFGASPLRALLDSDGMVGMASLLDLDTPLCDLRAEHPELGKLGAIIDRCLIKRKEDRLGSAAELAEELTAFVAAQASGTLENHDPFAGLSAFQEGDAVRFFGRDRAIHQAVQRLAEQPLLMVMGASGAGKSSFVRAGLIPALKQGGDAWEAFVLRPGPYPLLSLAELLMRHSWRLAGRDRNKSLVEEESTAESSASDAPPIVLAPRPIDPRATGTERELQRDVLGSRLSTEPGFLAKQLRARARRKGEKILLVIDQLEEVYTLASARDRAAFFACLAGVADDVGSPLRVVTTLRSDFLDRLVDAQSILPGLGFLLMPLDRNELREALTKPIAALDYRFDPPELVERMLNELSHTRGALPLLQFTAAQLWAKRDTTHRTLTEASYLALGGVGGTLARHADELLSAMPPKDKPIVRSLLLRLVTPERTRALPRLGELLELPPGRHDIRRTLDRLIAARLLTVDGNGEEDSTVEIVHESLIMHWPTLNRWLDEETDDALFLARLRTAAREWRASGERAGLLWTGEAAGEAARFPAGRIAELAPAEARFLAAVIERADRARKRRRRSIAGAFVMLSVAVLSVSYLAFRARTEARRSAELAAEMGAQKSESERNAVRARNASRLSAARERQNDPTTALALLREIEPGSIPPGWVPLAHWALHAGVARFALPHVDVVLSVAWSADGRRIATASADNLVRLWSADGSGEPLVLRGHQKRVTSVAFSADSRRVVSSSFDKTLRLCNADGSGEPLVLRGHDHIVRGVAFAPDGRRIASASDDHTVRVWTADGAGEPLVLRGHEADVLAVSWSPDGLRIASVSRDNTVRVWSADGSGTPIVLRGHNAATAGLAWSSDGLRIASASHDGTARVWNADGSNKPVVFRGHGARVYSVEFSPRGGELVTTSADHTVRLWNVHTAQPVHVFRGHGDHVVSAAFSPDGRQIASASWDRTVRIWDAVDPKRPLKLSGHEGEVMAAEMSPNGRTIASAGADKTVRIWNSDGTGVPLVFRGHEGRLFTVSFSPDGRRVVSASADHTARVWNTDGTGTPLILRGHASPLGSAMFSPDGRHIVTAGDNTVRIWNADGTGTPLVFRAADLGVWMVTYGPDGRQVVSTSRENAVRIWNAAGAGELLSVQKLDAEPRAAAYFSPDAKRLACGFADRVLRIWNVDGTGAPLLLRGHEGAVGLTGGRPWSPDGRRLVSQSDDGTVRIWSTEGSGEPVVLLDPKDTAAFSSAAWSPDGLQIVAGSDDGRVWVWRDFEPPRSPDDPRLWTATRHCPSVEDRQRLLDVSREMAQRDLARCEQRIRDAAEQRAGSR
ncbi:MAG: protein kinase [Polyangiaceae bacterium]|nr:protein kinase [Polyangiaceae bacterium]